MNVTYTDQAKQSADGLELLQQATKRLEGILSPSRNRVTAVWNRQQDARGRPVYGLRLSDWKSEVAATFAPNELQSSSQLHYQLLRLWGDLLQVTSQKLLDDLTRGDEPAEG